jgi:hypothetical protein
MKKIVLCFFLLMSISGFCQNNPFTKLQFDSVVLYDFIGDKGEEESSIIDKNGRLAKSVTKQITLDQSTIAALNKKLESRTSYGAGTSSCFIPHLGIVYYLKNKPVAFISICMDCNRLRSSKNIPAQNQGKTGKGKAAYYLLDGMSNSFRSYLNGILKKYNFSHQGKE